MTETKGGNIILRRVDVPDHVDPGESFEVDALVSNGAAYINPWDGDKCGLAPPGYTIEVDFHGPDGATRTKGADVPHDDRGRHPRRDVHGDVHGPRGRRRSRD
ncbi:hypothetical protein [Haloarcula marina]|uniref:hypothetical protein n=1 Tax=Haloarcula marina TaxID=2961574 RepID=UPI0020B737FC|nr:hypothetical protein [Halomicroarcula marina]